MALRKPVAIYCAESNIDAHLLCQLLRDAGIEAAAVEDISTAGIYSLGTVSGIHRPEVWVEREDAERAAAFIADFEARQSRSEGSPPAEHFCYHCGAEIGPDSATCGSCGQAVEPPEEPTTAAEGNPLRRSHAEEGESTPAAIGKLRSLKKPFALAILVVVFAPIVVFSLVFLWHVIKYNLLP